MVYQSDTLIMANIILPIKNFAAQQAVFDSPARFVVVPKGRRFGITTGAKNDLIKGAIKRTYKSALWGDVVNSNIEKYIQRLFIPTLSQLPEGTWKWTKDPHTIQIFDSYIDFRSAERPMSWEGFKYDYIFLNEAGIILMNPYLWENAVQPMMWDNPKSRAIFGGTPKIGSTVFKELYDRALDPTQPNYEGFKFSSFDNPYLPRELIMEDIKGMQERVVRQEIYADFLDDDGVVFRGIEQVAILDPNNTPEVDYTHLYVIGCDIAKLVDYTVITVYDRTDNNQVFQMRFNKIEYPAIKARIQHVSRKYNNALVYLDSTGVGEPVFDDLSRSNVPVEHIHLTNELKKQMIEKLSNFIELRQLRMLKDPATIQELKQFTYDLSEKTKRVIYGAPIGFHDDIVCFTKGTLILTNKGQIPIEKIKIGDLVITRKGLKPVVNVMSRNKEVIYNKALHLEGTPDHPIITKNGTVGLANTCTSDIIYMWNERLSSIEEKTITDIQTQKDDNSEFISGDMINGRSLPLLFIGKYGLIILAKFLKGLLSIMRIQILSIMNLLISSFSGQVSIIGNTCLNLSNENGQARMERNKHLICLKHSLSGERIILKKHINLLLLMALNMVEKVRVKDGEKKKKKVYNLTIAEQPEYFANNILVHNCAHALAVWGMHPVQHKVATHEMSIIERDIAIKTSKIKEDDEDFEEIDGWGLYGNSDN